MVAIVVIVNYNSLIDTKGVCAMENSDVTEYKQGEIQKFREYKVVKHNDIIQKAKFDFNATEQKMIAYIVSKIKPTDTDFKEYDFSISDFCKVCGIQNTNYEYMKTQIKNMADKSTWLLLDDGKEILFRWFTKVTITPNDGTVKVIIDNDMQKYIIDLGETSGYTSYELVNVLCLSGKYSIRLYELFKSNEFKHKIVIDIEKLKDMLYATNDCYKNYSNFKAKVLMAAKKEIDYYTDITVDFHEIRKGRKVVEIMFVIKKKDVGDRLEAYNNTTQYFEKNK